MRNYKRILLLSIGVILAVSLIAGINIGVEAISRGVLASYVQNVPYDMSLVQQDANTSYLHVSQQLSGLSEVSRVETVISWTPYFSANLTSLSVADLRNLQFTLVGASNGFPARYNVTILQGGWNLTAGVVLPTSLAAALKVNVGDWLNVSLGYPDSTAASGVGVWSARIQVAGVALFSEFADSIIFGTPSAAFPQPGGRIVNIGPVGPESLPIIMSYDSLLSDYRSFRSQADKGSPKGSPFFFPNFQVFYRIFLNRNAVIDLFDADSTLARLVSIENGIRIEIVVPNTYLQDHLADAIYSYRNWLQGNLVGFYFFSLPVLPISWYLAMTSWYTVTSRRRQEFGLLKVRGVPGRQIFRTAILESIVIGVIGSALGTVAGFLVGAVMAQILGSPTSLAITVSAITPEILGISVAVGTSISILAALRPARLAAGLEPTEAVKEYQGEEVEAGKPWRPTWTWGALALGTYKMLEWLLSFSPATVFPNGPPSNNFFLSILFFVWVSLSIILIPAGPFLFVYGLTKIITRSQTRLYRSTAMLLRTFLKDTANITARALSRNPARVSRVAFLIALTITFGIFVNVSIASSWDLQVRLNRLQVGADINVRTFAGGFNESFVSNLTAIQGISQVTPILTSYAATPYTGVQSITLYGIDAGNFLDVAYADEEFTIGPAGPLFQMMQATPNATIVSEGLANFLNLRAGDIFQITPQGGNSTLPLRLTVVGFFKNLPGIGSLGVTISGPPNTPGQFFYGGSIITSISYLRKSSFFTPSNGFIYLCKLSPNIDAEQEAAKIRESYGQSVAEIDTLQGRLQQLNASASGTSMLRFLQLTSAYFFIAAIIGFALISWANTQDRLREIAIFRSRGTSRRQAMQILFAESFVILLLAIVIGVVTGVLGAYGVLNFFTSLPNSVFAGLSLRLIFPPELSIMLVASIASFLISILISAWLSLRKTVVETIRFR